MTENTASPAVPFGRLIKGIILAGALFLVFVVIAASQKPKTGPLTLEEAAARLPGFHLTPPQTASPAPDAIAGEGTAALYLWPSACAAVCAREFTALSESQIVTSGFRPVAVRTLNREAGKGWLAQLPEGTEGVVDWAGDVTSTLGGGSQSVVILYRNGREIGRGRGIDWSKPAAETLIRALEVTL